MKPESICAVRWSGRKSITVQSALAVCRQARESSSRAKAGRTESAGAGASARPRSSWALATGSLRKSLLAGRHDGWRRSRDVPLLQTAYGRDLPFIARFDEEILSKSFPLPVICLAFLTQKFSLLCFLCALSVLPDSLVGKGNGQGEKAEHRAH